MAGKPYFSSEEMDRFHLVAKEPDLIDRMRNSVAPNIFGHDDIKLGILLMLLGGVHKTTRSGSRLRGDLNICLVGDPSTAKSQFLKYWLRLVFFVN